MPLKIMIRVYWSPTSNDRIAEGFCPPYVLLTLLCEYTEISFVLLVVSKIARILSQQ